MNRPITGYRQDADGHWIALLGCGHTQHVRHEPPFVSRLWVNTEAGRRSRLGENLNCVRCDRFELPDAVALYSRTPAFTQETVPAGLLKDHATRAGTWGKIIVEAGVLRYHVPALAMTLDLSPETPGIVLPEVVHHVEPLGPVRFHVEFYRASG